MINRPSSRVENWNRNNRSLVKKLTLRGVSGYMFFSNFVSRRPPPTPPGLPRDTRVSGDLVEVVVSDFV